MRRLLLGLALLAACDPGSSSTLPSDAGVADAPVVDAPVVDAGILPVTIELTSQGATTGQPRNTTLVAVQDGDGPWRIVDGDEGVYRFAVTGQRYGLLAACDGNGTTLVDLGFFTVSDGPRFVVDNCAADDNPDVRITGTIDNVPAGDGVWITDGWNRRTFADAVRPWRATPVSGPGTLVGLKVGLEGMVIQPVTYAEGAAFELDFAEMFPLVERDLGLDLTSGGFLFVESLFLDPQGGEHLIDDLQGPAATYHAVPAERLGGGLSLLRQRADGGGGVREIQRAFRDPVAQSLTLPPALVVAPPTLDTTTPYPIAEVTFPERAGAAYYEVTYYTSPGDGTTHLWRVMYSAAWAAATPGPEIVSRFPDLSALPGWRASFALAPGAGFWSVSIVGAPARLVPGAVRFGYFGRSTARLEDGDEVTRASAIGRLP